MAYEKHGTFLDPSNVDQPIWRYLDLSKFAHLLATRHLHFTRLDQFHDPFEGCSTPLIAATVAKWYADACERENIPVSNREPPERVEKMILSQRSRTDTFANCWHLSDYESAAMWSQYLSSGEGIAIRSTYRKLQKCFDLAQCPVYVGAVRYIDYDSEVFHDAGNLFSTAVHKRLSFEHEKEVRAVIARWPATPEVAPETGIDIPVLLDGLIESVYVAPGTGLWFTETVKAVVRAFNFNFPVHRSTLLDPPSWTK